MGNIRQDNIKNAALMLLEKYPDKFIVDNFKHNKEKVQELLDVKSKLLRNRIAGYITKRLSIEKRKKTGSIQEYAP